MYRLYCAIFQCHFNTYWALHTSCGTGLYVVTQYFKSLYLDAGLSSKHDVAKTEDLTWLNQFGTIGTFLKNDIKLIKRNKRSKTTVGLSVIFSWFLFFTNSIEVVTILRCICRNLCFRGFLITFGQFVPSWDSSYYQLMMTQNIPLQRLLEFKMVAHGYRYNCYYNHCFLLSLLWVQVYLTIIGCHL
jgi:hypothetical protein